MSSPNPVSSTPTPDMNVSSGRAPRAGCARDRGRGYYGTRGGRGYHRYTCRPRESAVSATSMNGHVFQGFGETSNQGQYSKTIEELEA